MAVKRAFWATPRSPSRINKQMNLLTKVKLTCRLKEALPAKHFGISIFLLKKNRVKGLHPVADNFNLLTLNGRSAT
jgi:hypothetical protein